MEKLISRETILLPGGNKQAEHLFEKNLISGNNALIIGAGCESLALRLSEQFTEVQIIVNEYKSLMQSRDRLQNADKVKIKMMDYAHTDFNDNYFDLIYAQASISVPDRKNIIKEIKRTLKNDGTVCIGEIVSLKEPVPTFVRDIWERSGLDPLPLSGINEYYENRGISITSEINLTATLKDFFQKLRYEISKTSKDEKEANKKFYSAVKHEADAYLKLGGDKFIGFISFIMRKVN